MAGTVFGPKGGLLQSSLKAGAAIVVRRFIKRGADKDTGIHATAASAVIGISEDNQDNVGKVFPLTHRPGELTKVESGAAFALDALLTPDANGMAVTATTGQKVAAIAREAATAANQYVTVEVAAPGTLAP